MFPHLQGSGLNGSYTQEQVHTGFPCSPELGMVSMGDQPQETFPSEQQFELRIHQVNSGLYGLDFDSDFVFVPGFKRI